MKILVCGAGGFIGGHLVRHIAPSAYVTAVDIKPIPRWYQVTRMPSVECLCLDLSNPDHCRRACEGVTEVYQLAASMGGIGYISQEHVDCMENVMINVYMLEAAYEAGVERFFYSSSACAYNTDLQQDTNVTALKESDAYPAMAERGYGWEKLYSEQLCQEYTSELGMQTFIARLHNVYGPWGTWNGGREKAPAAIARKVAEAKDQRTGIIDIWGDGTQTRSFMWIEDCVEGIERIVACPDLIATPINLGSSELVTINQLVDMVEEIAGTQLVRRYNIDAPRGVAGRNSDNTFIKQVLGWEPSTPLKVGLMQTYAWIAEQYLARKAGKRVIQ